MIGIKWQKSISLSLLEAGFYTMMHQQTVVSKLIFVFTFYLTFRCVKLNTNERFDHLHYNTNPVNWTEAYKQCSDNSEALVDLNPNPDKSYHNISVVKRSVHLKPNSDSWVGDYSTYEVISGQGAELNVSARHCAVAHITSETELNDSAFQYQYDLRVENCTSNFKGFCIDSSKTLTISGSDKDWSKTQRSCRLWTPEYNTLPVAKDDTFATGNFTASKNEPSLVAKSFWVDLLVKEIPSVIPVVGNILRCGYITHSGPGIYYADCYEKKSYICQQDEHGDALSCCNSSNVTEEHQNALASKSQSAGMYAGISIALVVIVAVVVAVAIVVWRKRRQCSGKNPEKLPHGGVSFTRRKRNNSENNGADNASFKDERRVTTYNQINFNHVTPNVIEGHANKARDLGSPEYATIDRASKKANKPDVVPRTTLTKNPTVGSPGYLSMNGKDFNQNADVDKEYDFLESTRSTIGRRYEHLDKGENVYSSTSETNESTYDVTFQRGSSQKRLISEEYDHVLFENGSETMNKRMCDSINAETRVPAVQMSQPRSNPGYDKVIIQ